MPKKYNRNMKMCSTKILPEINTKYLQYRTLYVVVGVVFSSKVHPPWLKQAKNSNS